MKVPRISVIVPIYNVEQYLEKCIQSILDQTYTDFELLLIDDGSTDGSALICQTACNCDNRIRYFYKKNGGLSDARNYGLKHIRGEYVAFIDSDDWVEPCYLEYLYKAVRIENSDVSTCIFMIRSRGRAKPWKTLPETPNILSSRDALLSLLFEETINVSANSKLWRSALFKDISFPSKKRFEDVGTTYKLVKKAETVAVGGAPLYNYLMRPGSITRTKDTGFFDRLELAEKAFLDLKDCDREICTAAERYYVFHALSVLRSCDLNNPIQKAKAMKIRKDVLEHKASVLSNSRTPKRDKLALYALSLGASFYKFAWNIYCVSTGRNG